MTTARNVSGLARAFYRRLFRREEDAQLRSIVETLQHTPVFQTLARGDLRELAEAMHVRTYKRDEFLYYEQDPGLGLYVVQRGRVRLFTEDEAGVIYELRQVGEREIFGEISLFGSGDLRRMETAQALTETRVLGFFSPDLKTMLRRTPKTAAAVTMALARYLALRQVETVRLLAERQGKAAAMRLLNGAHPPAAPPTLA
ncbi:Crp/Fnr family transcriptional regulator [Rhodocaloribacter sp.]